MSYLNRVNDTGTVSTTLTAAGNGDGVVNCVINRPQYLQLQVVVASINTNVTVRMQYSSVSNFASDTVLGDLHTITADGTYIYAEEPSRQYARPVFVAESGGTDATVAFTIFPITNN